MKPDLKAIRAWGTAAKAHDEMRAEVEDWMKTDGRAGQLRQNRHAPMWPKYEAAVEAAATQNITGAGVLALCDYAESLEKQLAEAVAARETALSEALRVAGDVVDAIAEARATALGEAARCVRLQVMAPSPSRKAVVEAVNDALIRVDDAIRALTSSATRGGVEHLRPDGKPCAYLADIACNKCGWANWTPDERFAKHATSPASTHAVQPVAVLRFRRRLAGGDDTEPRPPGCLCHLEAGDSPCPAHGEVG